jgi:hypothetical protein
MNGGGVSSGSSDSASSVNPFAAWHRQRDQTGGHDQRRRQFQQAF